MKLKWYAVTATLTCCFLFGSSADTAVDVDINNAVDNNGMAVNFGGGTFLDNNTWGYGQRNMTQIPTITNGAQNAGATYSGPDLDVAWSKDNPNNGAFGIGSEANAGFRIRVNNTVATGQEFFSTFVFAVAEDGASFEEANDDLTATGIIGDTNLCAEAQFRFVVENAGAYYASEVIDLLPLAGNVTNANFTVDEDALTLNWFAYNTAANPGDRGEPDGLITTSADPTSFTDIGGIGFLLHQESTKASLPAYSTNGLNMGVKTFVATVASAAPPADPDWQKQEWFDFNGAAGLNLKTAANSGALGSIFNNGGGPSTDGSGNLVVSQAGQLYRKLPDALTANASAADEYATPLASGRYKLELNLASWALQTNATVFQLRGNTSGTGGSSSVGLSLEVYDAAVAATTNVADGVTNITPATTEAAARIRGFHSGGNYRALEVPLTNSTPIDLAIDFDYDTGVVTYYTNNVVWYDNLNAISGSTQPFGSLWFTTDGNSTVDNLINIDSLGLKKFVGYIPNYGVSFSRVDVVSGVQLSEYFSLGFDETADIIPNSIIVPVGGEQDNPTYIAEKTTTNAYVGPAMTVGMLLNPVGSGLITGPGVTNGFALSAGSNGGVKLQLNGPGGGDETGRYAKDDEAHGLFMFFKDQFLINSNTPSGNVWMHPTNDVLSASVQLATKEDRTPESIARLASGAARWVIKDDGSYYISDEAFQSTENNTGTGVAISTNATQLTWNEYNPTTSITNIGSVAALQPALTNIQAVGLYVETVVATNVPTRRYPFIGMTAFDVSLNTVPPAPVTPLSLLTDWLGEHGLTTNDLADTSHDTDSYSVFEEYAFGGDPTVDDGSSIGPVFVSDDTGFNFYHIHRERMDNTGLVYTVELDGNNSLVFGGDDWTTTGISSVGEGTAGNMKMVTNATSTVGATEKFIRLKVEMTE